MCLLTSRYKCQRTSLQVYDNTPNQPTNTVHKQEPMVSQFCLLCAPGAKGQVSSRMCVCGVPSWHDTHTRTRTHTLAHLPPLISQKGMHSLTHTHTQVWARWVCACGLTSHLPQQEQKDSGSGGGRGCEGGGGGGW